MVGGRHIADGENAVLAGHLQVGGDLNEAVRPAGSCQVAGEVVTYRGDPVAPEPDVRGHGDTGLGDDRERLQLAGQGRRAFPQWAVQQQFDADPAELAAQLGGGSCRPRTRPKTHARTYSRGMPNPNSCVLTLSVRGHGPGLVDRRAVSLNGVDAVVDTVGRGLLPDSIELAGGPERVITVAGTQA